MHAVECGEVLNIRVFQCGFTEFYENHCFPQLSEKYIVEFYIGDPRQFNYTGFDGYAMLL